jgi:hypothetical protein
LGVAAFGHTPNVEATGIRQIKGQFFHGW